MQLFDKVYSCYYQVVKRILKEAGRRPVTQQQIDRMIREYGFLESTLLILPRLLRGEWALLNEDGNGKYTPVVSNIPCLPLTSLQKSWLKALMADSRTGLFLEKDERAWAEKALKDAEPLFLNEDFYYFDRYSDGDDYVSEQYQENFRLILSALEKKNALFITYKGKKEQIHTYEILPCRLQYSSKNDRFRLYGFLYSHSQGRFCREITLNLSRIRACHLSKRKASEESSAYRFRNTHKVQEPVVIEISAERNALERCMLHFANYEKHTEYDEERNVCICSVYYDKADETELLIDILSFGPVIRVLGPEPFLNLVKARVRKQHRLLHEA